MRAQKEDNLSVVSGKKSQPSESSASIAIKKLKKKPAASVLEPTSEAVPPPPANQNAHNKPMLLIKNREQSTLGDKTRRVRPETSEVVMTNPGRTAGGGVATGRLRHVEHTAGNMHFRYGAEYVGELEGSTVNTTSHLLDNFGQSNIIEQRSRPPPTRGAGGGAGGGGAGRTPSRNTSTHSTQLYTVPGSLPLKNQSQSSKITPVECPLDQSEIVVTARTDHTDRSAATTQHEAPLYSSSDIDQRVRQAAAGNTLNLYEVSQRLQAVQTIPTKASVRGHPSRLHSEPSLIQAGFHPFLGNKSAGRRYSQQGQRQKVRAVTSLRTVTPSADCYI